MIFCLTVGEAAAAMGMNLKHVYYLLYMGRIEGWKVRDCWRIFPGSVEEYVKSNGIGGSEKNSPDNNDDERRRGVPSVFDVDGNADALGGRVGGIRRGSGVEHQSRGLPELFIKAFKPVRTLHSGRVNTSQIEFDFGVSAV